MEIQVFCQGLFFSDAKRPRNSDKVVSPVASVLWICDIQRSFCDNAVKKLKG